VREGGGVRPAPPAARSVSCGGGAGPCCAEIFAGEDLEPAHVRRVVTDTVSRFEV